MSVAMDDSSTSETSTETSSTSPSSTDPERMRRNIEAELWNIENLNVMLRHVAFEGSLSASTGSVSSIEDILAAYHLPRLVDTIKDYWKRCKDVEDELRQEGWNETYFSKFCEAGQGAHHMVNEVLQDIEEEQERLLHSEAEQQIGARNEEEGDPVKLVKELRRCFEAHWNHATIRGCTR
mmetsp:Transcript_44301/g.95066  ORF Transcript_44301/g.95066 Transcript_44301/m.95066 type:complete len:180 (-) Transcript_44301:271-810(-)